MSIYIFANVTRASAPVGSAAISCQLDLMSIQDALAYGGASSGEGPHFRYNGFTWAYITLLQGDKLTDTTNVDPKTSTNTAYRIIGDPEHFPDSHYEFVCDRVIGT
jgi:hypothetical protein